MSLIDISFCNNLYSIQYELSQMLSQHEFCCALSPKIKYVYNPIIYAKDNYLQFLNTYIKTPKRIMFLGMNPGPWGMVQTGVPFGEVNAICDWLKLNGNIFPPPDTHPLRPVLGFECKRSEVSGKRFWDLAKDISKSDPLLFFKNSFVYNYYPLALLSESGKNITPSDLKICEQKKLYRPCDEALCKIVDFLQVEFIIAIGRFAEKRSKEALKSSAPNVQVFYISHPSPRNPESNKKWNEKTLAHLAELDLLKYFV